MSSGNSTPRSHLARHLHKAEEPAPSLAVASVTPQSQLAHPPTEDFSVPPYPFSSFSAGGSRPMEIAESIKTLHALHKDGGLTEAEFAQAKHQILESSPSHSCSHSSHPSSRDLGRHRVAGRHSSSSVAGVRRRNRSARASLRNTSSSSSSSQDISHFIVVPRSKVWKALGEHSRGAVPYVPSTGLSTFRGAHRDTTQPQEVDETMATENDPLIVAVGCEDPVTGEGAPTRSSNRGHTLPVVQRHGKYGTLYQRYSPSGEQQLQTAPSTVGGGDATHPTLHVTLDSEDDVHVRYFNSRGRSGDCFSKVVLSEDESRPPFHLAKCVTRQGPRHPPGTVMQKAFMTTGDGDGHPPMSPGTASQLPPETTEDGDALSPLYSVNGSSTCSSQLEQTLNWYWVEITGRDPSRERYDTALRYVTRKFKLCESFLVDRDHTLALPQVCESPNYPGQYLLNLRVATDTISIEDDSVLELTNRWIVVVDLNQHVVLTLHRIDTYSMAQLRAQWHRVMTASDVSFQEFLLKIVNDALLTYQRSLDVHTDLLDKCESKIFVTEGVQHPVNKPAASYLIDNRILYHFAGSSSSALLRNLLDAKKPFAFNKGEMNSFLHHLHRRTTVQHRMLNITQAVLAQAFTKLRLCSKEMAHQMCANCNELSGLALEVREDAKTLLDLHISLQSFRTNELMAVLTRVSLMFTPCTFLAGVYGMNFRWFPELEWWWAYPTFWVACLLTVLIMRQAFLHRGFTG